MIYFLALLPATALTVGGYVVLVLSARTEGALRTFGKYLGFWAFTLAGLIMLGAIFAAAHGSRHCPFLGMHGMHEPMYCPPSSTAPTSPPSPPRGG
jgi:hypothetical protein